MAGRTGGWKNERTEGQPEGRTDGQKDGQIDGNSSERRRDGRKVRWLKGHVDGRMD